jgi:hypothetical protein
MFVWYVCVHETCVSGVHFMHTHIHAHTYARAARAVQTMTSQIKTIASALLKECIYIHTFAHACIHMQLVQTVTSNRDKCFSLAQKMHIHTYIHMHIHTYICAYMHTHTVRANRDIKSGQVLQPCSKNASCKDPP